MKADLIAQPNQVYPSALPISEVFSEEWRAVIQDAFDIKSLNYIKVVNVTHIQTYMRFSTTLLWQDYTLVPEFIEFEVDIKEFAPPRTILGYIKELGVIYREVAKG